MVESARKRGPFDPRYPSPTKLAPPNWELSSDLEAAETVDWFAFMGRFFPTRHRHGLEALAAYEAYRNALERVRHKHPSTRGRFECGMMAADDQAR